MIKDPNTPRSQIYGALRQLWLKSRERGAAMKRDNYCCVKCGIKQSAAKGKEVRVQVHHVNGCEWDELIELIRKDMLCDPMHLETLCGPCHKDAN